MDEEETGGRRGRKERDREKEREEGEGIWRGIGIERGINVPKSRAISCVFNLKKPKFHSSCKHHLADDKYTASGVLTCSSKNWDKSRGFV